MMPVTSRKDKGGFMVSEGFRTVEIQVSILVRKEGSQYASWCPEFDVASCGDTIEEACDNLDDAIDLYLDTLVEEDELFQVFDERGFVPSGEKEICEHPFLSSHHKAVTVPAWMYYHFAQARK